MRERHHERTEQAIRDEFSISERGGKLWFTHNGVAIRQADSGSSIIEVIWELTQLRDAAVRYYRL